MPAESTISPFTYDVAYLSVSSSGATLAACRTNIRTANNAARIADTNTDNCRMETIFYQNKNGTYGAVTTWWERRHSVDQAGRW